MTKIFSYVIILNCMFLLTHKQISAQDLLNDEIKMHVFDLGIGLGLDYGGLMGTKLSYIYPSGHVSTFGSVGLYFEKKLHGILGPRYILYPRTTNIFSDPF